MESGLIFNQLICEFESRHPCQTLIKSWGHSLNKNNHREVAKAESILHACAGNGSSMQACSAPRGALHWIKPVEVTMKLA